jgi:hypothetical protein
LPGGVREIIDLFGEINLFLAKFPTGLAKSLFSHGMAVWFGGIFGGYPSQFCEKK